jgi:Ca2+-binding RTX toxin-like protein
MAFNLQQMLEAFFQGVVAYGGTGMGGSITGNVTGGGGSGSSYGTWQMGADGQIYYRNSDGQMVLARGSSSEDDGEYLDMDLVYDPATGKTIELLRAAELLLSFSSQNHLDVIQVEEIVLALGDQPQVQVLQGEEIILSLGSLNQSNVPATVVIYPTDVSDGIAGSDNLGTQDYSSNEPISSHSFLNENGNLVYVDMTIYAPKIIAGETPSAINSFFQEASQLGYSFHLFLYGENGVPCSHPDYESEIRARLNQAYETYGEHFSPDYVNPTALYIDGSTRTVSVVLSTALGTSTGDVLKGRGMLFGGDGDDLVTGSSYGDLITGDADNDTLDGGRGNDALFGGLGDDSLEGGFGNDVLKGEEGNNILEGGAGADTLDGSGGFAVASYRNAWFGVTVDLSDTSRNTGEAAGDTFINVNGLWGSAHHDTLVGNAHANWIIADGGNDLVQGLAGADTLYGSTGDDTLEGGQGNDTLYGESGNNILEGGEGADAHFGAGGFAVASYRQATGAVQVYLDGSGTNTGEAQGDTYDSVNGLWGSGHADVLVGNQHGNWIIADGGHDLVSGGLGDDTLYGSTGNDTLDAGEGTNVLYGESGDDALIGCNGVDTLDGGEGYDTASYANNGVGVTVNLATGSAWGDTLIGIEGLIGSAFNDQLTGDGAANRLSGGAGNDYLSGDAGIDTLSGGTGDDRLAGGAGADRLDGGEGTDTAVYTTASSGVTAGLATPAGNLGDAAGDTYMSIENLTGSSHADVLTGDGAANVLLGQGGHDRLLGGGGGDTLDGGLNNDTLAGGAGCDQLTGGQGQDVFLFDASLNGVSNLDRIIDFAVADDRIQLSGSVFAGLGAGTLASGAFKLGTTATATSHRIVYDQASGTLSYDADGSGAGAAVKFAALAAGTALMANHFLVL